MQIHNIRETIVAGASSSRRAECFDRSVGKAGTRPTRIPIGDSPHAARGKQAATAVDRAGVLRQHA
jgi:hypothetical protein